jgi:type IV pilus assembly protein PilY1
MGSNDGVLHALNLGFYGSLADGTIGYSKKTFPRNPQDPSTAPSAAQHELGSELWGYVPTSVLPHLTWAADPEYAHSYYVDLEPMIVDIKNTTNSSINLGGGKTWGAGKWRTVLIGGLRLGGRTIELDNGDSPVKYLYSEYFALDITDPEEEPTLLWRFSHQDLGLTITKPAVVSSQDGWHVLIGSGPTTDLTNASNARVPAGNGGELAYGGVSNQKARVFVLNAYNGTLQKILGGDGDAFMPQGQTMPANSFFNNSFVVSSVGPGSGSLVTQGATPGSVDWHNPTVYFGLTVSRDFNRIDSGGLYRVQMVKNDGAPAPVSEWKLTTMYKTDRPVTGAVNATFDALGNMWVVFGTGRLWSEEDQDPGCSLLTDAGLGMACEENHTQYLYGLKEPMVNGLLTYAELKESGQAKIADVTEARVYEDGTVENYDAIGTTTYNYVLELMGSDSYIGYKRGLNIFAYTNTTHSFNTRKYEMILTQPKLDPLPNGRSNMVFSTYEPSTEICDPEGHSYLYLVDTYTGLPAPYMAAYNFDYPSEASAYSFTAAGGKTYDMITGYLSSGQGQSTEAWIIKSENATVYGNTSANQVQNKIVLETSLDGFSTGTLWWREVLDLGLNLSDEELTRGLPTAHD